MPLADILRAMEQEVDTQVARIESQAAATVAQIRGEAEAEANAIRQRHCREIKQPLQHERARRLNRARLDALRATSRAREQLLNDAVTAAKERLARLRDDPAYPQILNALVQETLAQLDGDAIVRADPRDERWLRGPLGDVPLEFDLDTWGGIEARTRDGRIRVVNTLEARLAQSGDLLRQEVLPLFDVPSTHFKNDCAN